MIKDYYSLNELETKYSIPKEDVFWLAEQEQIHIFLFCKSEKVIVGYKDEDLFQGVGTTTYRGMIAITRHKTQDLIDLGSINVTRCFLVAQVNEMKLSHKYPFETETPNKVLSGWNADGLSLVHSKYPTAVFLPKEVSSLAGVVAPAIAAHKSIDKDSPLTALKDALDSQPKKIFSNESRKFSHQDIRISHESFQLLKQQISTDNATQNSEPLHKQLIRRVIRKYPGYSSGKILEVIQQDMDKDSPQFDTDCILIEVSKSEIIWQGKGQKQHTLTYASFKNLISKIKKEK